MSKKVRRGMHARILWPMLRSGIPEDFSNAESLTLHISRVNTALKTYVPDTHISISGNVVSFIVTAEMLKPLTSGEYRATIAYRKVSATSPTLWEPYIFDQPCFTLVDSSVDLGGATSGMEIETIELNGEIGIAKEGLPGASAYRIAVANGFDGDEVEWLLSLKRPALDAAEIATQAASSANSAAGKALDATSDLDAIKQALADSEDIREQKEQTRQRNELSRGTTFTEKIQASEQATSAATQAANEANTAAGKAIDATSDLDAIKQALADSEAIREQKEQTRQQNELSRGTTFTEKIQASEQATSAATQAANEANTAAGKAIDATSDLDAIKQALADSEAIREQKEQTRQQNELSRGTTFTEKTQASEQATAAANTAAGAQNTYNVTVAIPLSAGSYYTKTTARAAVPTVSRKLGLVVTYATADKIWYSEKYIGTTVAGWATEENWEYVPTAANMATKTDKTELEQLRSDIAYMYPSVPTSKRILADSGTIKSRSTLNELTNKFLDLLPNTKLLFCPHLAVKLRESGIYKYVTKLYDIGPAMLDGAQTTALNQPYLSGNIAPPEKYAIKNPNGGNAYLTHTPISFSATDKWSVSTMLNANGQTGNAELCGALGKSDIRINADRDVMFINSATPSAGSTVFNKYNKFYGKNTMLTFTSLGDGSLSLYINGAFISKNVVDTTSDFSGLLYSRDGNSLGLKGEIRYHCIRDIALSPTQVQEEYNYLRSLFPEIESVQIGTQTWATSNCEMTCTPQGNVIQETQAATNVEKIPNGISLTDSDNDGLADGFSTLNTPITSIVIGNGFPGRAQRVEYGLESGRLQSLLFGNVLFLNKWYRLSFKYRANKEYVITNTSYSIPGGILPVNTGDAIEKTIYFNYLRTGNTLAFNSWLQNSGDWFEIGDITLQEFGWADSTNLYNYIYANTPGTAEQKEYAALKAAAMWCYYNNDPALGSVYGKLYNWYAVKLLQMDIDYYNAANPTAPWGWRVPPSADFTTLSTYLGGTSVAGIKMKQEGIDYWSNTGSNGTNEAGFSGLGAGRRFSTGSFESIKNITKFRTSSGHIYELNRNNDSISFTTSEQNFGYSLRLIKS